MIVVTQGFGTSQLVLNGFGDNFTHADAPITINLTSGYWGWKRWGTFRWGDGGTTFMSSEGLPSITASVEGVPGRGAALDGAWTEVGTDGAWDDYPPDGAVTQNDSYLKELRPIRRGYTKEGIPTT